MFHVKHSGRGVIAMSKYTTEIRYICESYAGLDKSEPYPKVAEIIEKARPKIFDFDYPFFDQNYKPILERKILLHYYTREIAFETVGLFKLKLYSKMMDIMPYYNRLYESVGIEFDPLENVNYTKTYTRDIDGTEDISGEGTTSGDSNSLSKLLDTPQGSLEGLLGDKYLTSATTNESSNSSKQKSSSNRTHGTKEGYSETTKGKQGGDSYAKMLMEYRDTILNIDMMIIRELEELFFALW